MSDNQRNTHDPVIDTVEDSDDDEVVPTTPGQEHIDLATSVQENASLLSALNGDSLGTGTLHFKKSYNGVTITPPLEDDPMPLEPVTLPPFGMDIAAIHHNSPLSSRSSEPHNFNVSVSDSLPPLVMELDSPEHEFEGQIIGGDRDNSLEFYEHSQPTNSEIIDFPASDGELGSTADKHTNIGPSFMPGLLRNVVLDKELPNASSQGDLFSSQRSDNSDRNEDELAFEPRHGTDEKGVVDFSSACHSSIGSEIPSSVPERLPDDASLQNLLQHSTSKRKREEDILSATAGSKVLRLEPLSNEAVKKTTQLEASDNEIQIIDDYSQRDQSIEVVYDRKKDFDQIESQDMQLFLTGNTQSESSLSSSFQKLQDPYSKYKTNDYNRCDSLLSMPSSDNLLCSDSLSSSPSESQQPIESTMQPTQIEALCVPAVHSQQPNIESLLSYPIVKQGSTSTSHSNSSTNLPSGDERKGSHAVTSQVIYDTQDQASVQHTLEYQPFKNQTDSDSLFGSSICLPHFETPIEGSTDERSESLFSKASEAAKHKMSEAKELSAEKNAPYVHDSFGSSFSHTDADTPLNSAMESEESLPYTTASEILKSHLTPIASKEPLVLFSPRREPDDSLNKELFQGSQVLAEDSDDEKDTKSQNLKPMNPLRKHAVKTSTPNQMDLISPNLSKEGGSYIDSKGSTPVVEDQESKSDTQELSQNCEIKFASELLAQSNWFVQTESRKELIYKKWKNKSTGESVITVSGEEEVGRGAWVEKLVYNTGLVDSTSSGSSRGRISDISSISRVTSLSAGYLGDKSSSVEGSFMRTDIVPPLESTRHSTGSVLTIRSPPNPYPNTSSESEDVAVVKFIHPNATSSHRTIRPGMKTTVSVGIQTEHDFDLVSHATSQPVVKRGRKRGRPRGTGRRALLKNAIVRPLILEEDSLEGQKGVADVPGPSSITESPSPIVTSPKISLTKTEIEVSDGVVDDFLTKLPKEVAERLEYSHLSMSEEEEQLFFLQKQYTGTIQQERQHAAILKKIREVDIKPGMIVFARYHDNNFYSAVIRDQISNERWNVVYNLDNREYTVLEVNILPTDILPRGSFCYVRHHTGDFCDPGTVRGHTLIDNILIHLVETHRGIVAKVPHSHLLMKASHAEEMMHRRRSFRCLIASPGRDISLDNIIPKERPRKAAMTPTNKIKMPTSLKETASSINSPKLPRGKPRKADPNLDTSCDLKSEDKKTHSLVTLPGTSTSDVESSSAPSPPKSKRKLPLTPKTPKVTPSKGNEAPPSSKSKSKQVRVSSQKSAKNKAVLPVKEPPLQDSILKNPVVELVYLDEVHASPQKLTTLKRGKKKGTPTPKKMMKLSEDVEEEADVDSQLGPLPPEGSKLFEGYAILITSSGRTAQIHDQSDPTAVATPIDKSYLSKQIRRGGGRIIEDFGEAIIIMNEEISSKKGGGKASDNRDDIAARERKIRNAKTLKVTNSPTRLLCLSNTYCKTEKFVRCLAVGIPLVNSLWITHSCSQKSCLNWLNFLLPAGMSLVTGNIMEQIFKDRFKDTSAAVGKVAEVLNGEKVFLCSSSNKEFTGLYMTLLSAANAQVFTMSVKGNLIRLIDRRTSVVLADASIPSCELDRARDCGVPIVSSEWFVQSLIAGCKLPYDARPEFRYDYKKQNS